MPASKRRQSNDMLYILISVIGLLIVAVAVAVIYYAKAEDLRTQNGDLQARMDTLASSDEIRQLGSIVGAKMQGQSNLGTMVEHLNRMVAMIQGGPIPPTSAEVKVADTIRAVQKVLAGAPPYIIIPVIEPNRADPNAVAAAPADANAPAASPADPNAAKTTAIDPNRLALTVVMNELISEIKHTTEMRDALQQQLMDLQNRFDLAVADMQKTKDDLTNQVNGYRQEVVQIKTDYNDLRLLVERNSEEQTKILLDQLDQSRAESKQFNQDLLKTQAELTVAQNRLQDAVTKVNKISPPPDQEVMACKPDGKIIVVDDMTGIVRINLGSDDRVYSGLTFSVYDQGTGIPKDGKPKAEVEVFAIDSKVCAARVLSSERKNPIHTDDLVANLIWDSGHENHFVIAGDFDLTGDGTPDFDAITKIETLIRKWGGSVSEDVSADTDYIILGTEPQVPPEPTPETLAVDPTATEKYTAAQQRLQRYEQIRQRAQSLWIPIFNYERFLHFTGYANQVNKPGAF